MTLITGSTKEEHDMRLHSTLITAKQNGVKFRNVEQK